ncbi:MAG: NADPH:quinone oxidoreductase family protein [Microthrixaceae bacterium]
MCHELGPAGDLTIGEVPDPTPGPGQVLIEVRAAGVNYVDALFVEGAYQIKPPLPFVPGSEVAGIVTAVGPGTDAAPAVGSRVLASVGLGGFAELVAAPASSVIELPDNVGDHEAATLVQSYATMRFAFGRRTTVGPGEQVVVLGASGGIGMAAIDVARSVGARVVAVASSEERLARCVDQGAEATINSSTVDDLKLAIREATGGGADVIVDPIGGAASDAALRALGNFGRLVIIGFAAGDIPRLPANQVLLRNRTVVGVDWGAWAMANPGDNQALVEAVLADAAAGRLSPQAPSEFPLADVGRALADLQGRRLIGKAVLVP